MTDLNNQDQDQTAYAGTEGIPVERPDQSTGPGIRGLIPQGGWGGEFAMRPANPQDAGTQPAVPDENDDGATPREKAGGAPGGPLDSGLTDQERRDTHLGAARRAYQKNHPQNVADSLTKTFEHMPDGMDLQVVPGEGGDYNLTLAKNGKQIDMVPISQDTMERFLQSPQSGFEHVYDKGTQNAFRQLATSKPTPPAPTPAAPRLPPEFKGLGNQAAYYLSRQLNKNGEYKYPAVVRDQFEYEGKDRPAYVGPGGGTKVRGEIDNTNSDVPNPDLAGSERGFSRRNPNAPAPEPDDNEKKAQKFFPDGSAPVTELQKQRRDYTMKQEEGETGHEREIEKQQVITKGRTDVQASKNQLTEQRNAIELQKALLRHNDSRQGHLATALHGMLQWDQSPENIERVRETMKQFGLMGGATNQQPDAAPARAGGKHPPNADGKTEDGRFYVDKYRNIIQ